MADEKISVDNWLNKQLSLSIGTLLILAVLVLLSLLVINATLHRNAQSPSEAENGGLEIGSLIRKVKRELMQADTQRINNNERALFQLKDFQMEISFMVKTVTTAGAKIDYKFVTVDAGTETGNEKVQKLTLHWDAIPQKRDSLPGPDDDGEIIITSVNSKNSNNEK